MTDFERPEIRVLRLSVLDIVTASETSEEPTKGENEGGGMPME